MAILKNRFMAFCALWLFLLINISITHAETIILGAEDSWAPFSKSDGTGFSNTIVTEAYKAVGIDVELLVAPYARLLRDVEHGKLLGLFNVTREESTELRYNFGTELLFVAKTYYYHNKLRPLKATNLTELKHNERIGMIIGYEYGPYILRNDRITPVRVNSQESLVRMLIRNRLDSAIMFEAVANFTIPKIENSDTIVKAFEGEHSNIYVAFSPTFPDSKIYMDKLDEGIKILKSNNRISEILDQHPATN